MEKGMVVFARRNPYCTRQKKKKKKKHENLWSPGEKMRACECSYVEELPEQTNHWKRDNVSDVVLLYFFSPYKGPGEMIPS